MAVFPLVGSASAHGAAGVVSPAVFLDLPILLSFAAVWLAVAMLAAERRKPSAKPNSGPTSRLPRRRPSS